MTRRRSVARGAEQLGLQVGDDVRHDKFGEGVIVDIIGSGDKAEARVQFRDVGEKTLLLSWAPLSPRQRLGRRRHRRPEVDDHGVDLVDGLRLDRVPREVVRARRRGRRTPNGPA